MAPKKQFIPPTDDDAPEADVEAKKVDDEDEDYEPLLRISTKKKKRPRIEIDDQVYELALFREFGIADQALLRADGADFDRLYQKKPLTKSEAKELKIVLDRLFEKVLVKPVGMTDTQFRKLKATILDEDRHDIVTTFTYAPLQMAMQQAEAAQEETTEDEEIYEGTTPELATLDT